MASNERIFARKTNAAAKRISVALSVDLPPDIARQAFYEGVMRKLVWQHPWFMQLLMEDPFFRESYNAEVASRPAAKQHLQNHDVKS